MLWLMRWRNRCNQRGNASVAMARCALPRGHAMPHRDRQRVFAWHTQDW